MNAFRNFLVICTGLSAMSAFATGEISDVRVTSDAGKVTVTYALSENAVVTARFFADGEWIDEGRVTRISGDICRKVSATSGAERRSFTWLAHKENLSDAERGTFPDAKVELTAWALKAPPPWMVVDLAGNDSVRYYASAAAVPGGVTSDTYKTDKLLLFKVPAKHVEWYMGSPANEADRSSDETRHKVVLTDDFYLGVYPVTQRQSERVTGVKCGKPSVLSVADDSPMWPTSGFGYNAMRGAGVAPSAPPAANSILDQWRTATGVDLDLPTEAQWEFAFRAGTTGAYAYGSYAGNRDNSWTTSNGASSTTYHHAVGRFQPNGFGLYDMAGNVWEQVRDRWSQYAFDDPEVAVVDPFCADMTDEFTLSRGGSYAGPAVHTRSAKRYHGLPLTSDSYALGYRLMAPAEAR